MLLMIPFLNLLWKIQYESWTSYKIKTQINWPLSKRSLFTRRRYLFYADAEDLYLAA